MKFVGQYNLGIQRVKLYVERNVAGARFYCGDAKIIIGLKGAWPNVVSELCHEVFEMATAQMGLRFCPAPDYSSASDGWLFFMTHPQMGECVARMGHFVAQALPDMADAYKKARNDARKDH